MNVFSFPEFRPHPLIRGGHVQTIVANYLPGRRYPYTAARHRIRLIDGDSIVLHDDFPGGWQPGGPVALLVHGLAGCHLSAYMIRIAGKLNDVGVRAFRLDLRNCGAAQGLARRPYHAGRSDDLRAVLGEIGHLCPGSPVGLAGFSLGANIVLKLLGESPGEVPENVERSVAVCPPVDLARCVDSLRRPGFGVYDRYFVKLMVRQLNATRRVLPEIPSVAIARRFRRIVEFDNHYTAPICGFGTAQRYYSACSASQFLADIRVPTLILASADDPLIPAEVFDDVAPSTTTILHIAESGGHLGFLACRGTDPDRRWMDWRVVDWITGVLPALQPTPKPTAQEVAGS